LAIGRRSCGLCAAIVVERPVKQITWPMKKRELVTRFFDSTVWNDFEFRDNDIVIATYAKSGTTWMQQIVAQLIFNGAPDVEVHRLSPWLDMRILDREALLASLEAQRNRRFIKTHLPIDALVYSPRAKYIYVARDGRDAAWSYYDHQSNLTPEALGQINKGPDWLGPRLTHPDISAREYFLEWLERDGYPLWPYWSHVRDWCGAAHLPNLLIVHFADLKAALPVQIRRIAAFLGITIEEARLPAILEHCGFNYMKENAGHFAPAGGVRFRGGAKSFINKGTNGRWHDLLSPAEVARYEGTASRRLGSGLAAWLAEGGSLRNGTTYVVDHG
jgi:aryl sulfotransferase